MRESGILMHISSLPSRHGIGKMGKSAYDFVDFLEKTGCSYWQVLPLSPTSYGDSPYQSCSTRAGNPYFIDFDILQAEGLLHPADYEGINWGDNIESVDYALMYENCYDVLRKAFSNAPKKRSSAFSKFIKDQKDWLEEYALYSALKDQFHGLPWNEWETPYAMRDKETLKKAKADLKTEMEFYRFLQYHFFKQWNALKQYANEKGISIIGDIPIYAAYDSTEVWGTPELFQLDKEKKPVAVAGCPPDAFAVTGQLWGNPLYDWDYHKKTNFAWWIGRIRFASQMYDKIRIDHFRGFESYYSIPYGEETAVNGSWKKGPDYALFAAANKELGKLSIIAEDLGNITAPVRKLLKKTGYPGMKVMEFAFGGDAENTYLPHNYETTHCVCYTGTHDNHTLDGFVETSDKATLRHAKKYLNVKKKSEISDAMLRATWGSIAELAIAQMQDFLGKGAEARMNFPSTLGGNWQYRALEQEFDHKLMKKIKKMNQLYGRYQKKTKGKEKNGKNGMEK